MFDSSNKQLHHLVSEKEKKISNIFEELGTILREYKNSIFESLSVDKDFYEMIIGEKLGEIKSSIKPFHILQQGYEFLKQIKKEITIFKRGKNESISFRVQDSFLIIKVILDGQQKDWTDSFSDSWLKRHNRKKKFDSQEISEAYKTIGDSIRKFVEENRQQGIFISLSSGGVPLNYIDIELSHCDDLLRDLGENKQAEVLSEFPEFEDEDYKIDVHLSTEEKLENGWTQKEDPNKIIYLEKDLGENACVKEYLSKVDEQYIGVQMFNRSAINKLGLKHRLPKNKEGIEEIERMRIDENIPKKERVLAGDPNNSQIYLERFFSKNGKLMLSGLRGFYKIDHDQFHNINHFGCYRLGEEDPRFGSKIMCFEKDGKTNCHLAEYGKFAPIRLIKGR